MKAVALSCSPEKKSAESVDSVLTDPLQGVNSEKTPACSQARFRRRGRLTNALAAYALTGVPRWRWRIGAIPIALP